MRTIRKTLARNLGKPSWEVKDLGEKAQVQGLWNGVLEDTGHPLLVGFLARLIDVAEVPARDPVAFTRAVQLYSARQIKFFRERPERFQSAMRTVAWGIGDCDDKARFVAACLRTVRIPAMLEILRIDCPDGVKRGHVLPCSWLTDGGFKGWTCVESVREYPLGYDPKAKLTRLGWPFTVERIGDQGGDQLMV